jgi:peptide-methionine (R)-S-oxide reductase
MSESTNTKKKTDAEYKAELTPEQFAIARQGGTERAFTGKYWDCHDDGSYHCVCCGVELFNSSDKFESGSGWPSFTKPTITANVGEIVDKSHGMKRTEVTCSQCGAHLGHVFDDGPSDKGGLRYCINSASLDMKKKET